MAPNPSVSIRHALVGLVLLSAIVTCKEDPGGNVIVDQTWSVRYLVANESSIDVVLRWGSELFYSASTQIDVPAGQTKEINHYEEFLGPPPDAGRSFTCISVYRASDLTLVFQLTPVQNQQWRLQELGSFRHEYTLKLTDAKLDTNGLPNLCATLTGSAVDSLTATAIDGYFVSFRADSVCCGMRSNSAESEYFFMWPGDVTAGDLSFSRHGYRYKTIRVPDSVEILGDRHYRLNVQLAPEPVPALNP